MITCVAFTLDWLLWQRKLLKDSSCSHTAQRWKLLQEGEATCWTSHSYHQLPDSLGLLLQAWEKGSLSKSKEQQALPRGPSPLHRGKKDEAGGWVSSFGEGKLFTSLKFRNAECSAVVDITWSWRWSGFEVPNLYVGPLACCAWNSWFSSSDSSDLTDMLTNIP